jgi:cobalt-zinc-cadmium efflux system protein
MHMYAHGHAHAHAHGGSGEMPGTGALVGSMGVTLVLVAIELTGGIFSGSIALISDAIHNLSDVPSLAISWLGLRWASRPADTRRTYGYKRAGILAAFTNSILLIIVAGFLFYEAWQRVRHPSGVNESVMIWISVVALAINAGITLSVARGRHDLNLRTVFIHNLGDALSNVAILVGAIVMRATNARWIDPLLGAAIGVMVLWSSVGVLREASDILLEALPRDMELGNVARAILCVPGVQEVHDIHVWTLGTDEHALSCHVRIPDMHMEESERVLGEIRQRLSGQFHISHTTIQFERVGLPSDSGLYMPEPVRRQQ